MLKNGGVLLILFSETKPNDVKKGVRMLSLYLSMLESGEDKAKCTQLYEKYHGLLIHVAYAKLKCRDDGKFEVYNPNNVLNKTDEKTDLTSIIGEKGRFIIMYRVG